ncbi:MAG: hypothetical protein DBX47_05180 [Clostridiales bacterium]|nr:MAG: hypothetical protein DBX47_05180 [Clostridiales bacterium]
MKKTIALFLALLLVFLLFSSSFYIKTHYDHECCGVKCFICQTLDSCKKILTSFFIVSALLFYIFFNSLNILKRFMRLCKAVITPVRLKTKNIN